MKKLKDNLTEYEMNILKLLAKGYSNNMIASTVYCSRGNLNEHLRKIALKLGVSSGVYRRENILRQALISRLLDVQDLRR